MEKEVAKSGKKSLWNPIRKWFFVIHKWAGVVSALILFVVCLTGTIYTFQEDIIRCLNKEKYIVKAVDGTSPISIEDAVQKVKEATGVAPRFINIPYSSDNVWIANVVTPEGGRRGTNYFVNQFTGVVSEGGNLRGQAFFMTVFRLHRWLLLDTAIGRPIVGWATIIMILLAVSGIVLWFPRKLKNIARGLKIMWNGGSYRLTYDLHNVLGFYAAIMVLIMSVTGLFWSFDWSRKAIYGVLGVEAPGGPGGPQGGGAGQGQGARSGGARSGGAGSGQDGNKAGGERGERVGQRSEGRGERRGEAARGQRRGSGRSAEAQAASGGDIADTQTDPADTVVDSAAVGPAADYIAFAQLIEAANKEFSFKGNLRITIPSEEDETVSISKSGAAFFARAGSDNIVISRVSGEVVKVDRYSDKPLNQRIASSIRAIHTGEIFGTFSKILYFIACLIAASLPVTGLIMWIRKW